MRQFVIVSSPRRSYEQREFVVLSTYSSYCANQTHIIYITTYNQQMHNIQLYLKTPTCFDSSVHHNHHYLPVKMQSIGACTKFWLQLCIKYIVHLLVKCCKYLQNSRQTQCQEQGVKRIRLCHERYSVHMNIKGVSPTCSLDIIRTY